MNRCFRDYRKCYDHILSLPAGATMRPSRSGRSAFHRPRLTILAAVATLALSTGGCPMGTNDSDYAYNVGYSVGHDAGAAGRTSSPLDDAPNDSTRSDWVAGYQAGYAEGERERQQAVQEAPTPSSNSIEGVWGPFTVRDEDPESPGCFMETTYTRLVLRDGGFVLDAETAIPGDIVQYWQFSGTYKINTLPEPHHIDFYPAESNITGPLSDDAPPSRFIYSVENNELMLGATQPFADPAWMFERAIENRPATFTSAYYLELPRQGD